VRHIVPILAAISIVLIAAPAAPADSQPPKPILVVFDLDNPASQGQLGHTASYKILKKAGREKKFIIVEPIDVDAVVAATGFQPKADADPKEVLAFVKERFGADMAVWGHIARNADASLTLHIRAFRLEGEQVKTVLDERFAAADRFHLSQTADKIVSLLADRPAAVAADKAKMDLRWKVRKNLVRNGGFELGKGTPLYWQKLEPGMAVVKAQGHGRVLEFDIPKAVAETYGFDFFSDYIDVDETATYRFSVDYRSDGPAVIIFIKGYALFPPGEGETASQWREVYRPQRKAGAPKEWTTLTFDFHPIVRQHSARQAEAHREVKRIKVDLYAYHPPGKAYFDNVVVKKVFP